MSTSKTWKPFRGIDCFATDEDDPFEDTVRDPDCVHQKEDECKRVLPDNNNDDDAACRSSDGDSFEVRVYSTFQQKLVSNGCLRELRFAGLPSN